MIQFHDFFRDFLELGKQNDFVHDIVLRCAFFTYNDFL